MSNDVMYSDLRYMYTVTVHSNCTQNCGDGNFCVHNALTYFMHASSAWQLVVHSHGHQCDAFVAHEEISIVLKHAILALTQPGKLATSAKFTFL